MSAHTDGDVEQTQQAQQIDGSKITRDSVMVDGEELRFYYRDGNQWPSVSTILDARPTPARDKSLQSWREYQLSRPDRPDPDDILNFKGWRGTLVHYKTLDPLAPYDLLGEEEITAYKGLKNWEYNHGDALAQARSDVEWCIEQFQALAEQYGIAQYDGRGDDAAVVVNNARRVEQYVIDEDVGYAGQYDLAYENDAGQTVLADIKATKANSPTELLDKKMPRYGLQLAAYAKAARLDIDALQIIWISPDTKESAVIEHTAWEESWRELESGFCKTANNVHQTALSDF